MTLLNDYVIGSFIDNTPGTQALNTSQRVTPTPGVTFTVTPSSGSVFTTGGLTNIGSNTFTRPADTTAYAVGDLVANSTTAGSVVPVSLTTARVTAGSFILRRIRLRKSTSTLTNASFRVHLFNSSPTVTVGDNGVFNSAGVLASNMNTGYLGSSDITIDTGFNDGASGFSGIAFNNIQVKLASGQVIFALLEARAAYTPGSAEVFTIVAEVLQD